MAWTNLTKNTAAYSNPSKATSNVNFAYLLEDGLSYFLMEDGFYYLLEQSEAGYMPEPKHTATYTNLTKN